ncbi:FMN-binding negative transcriptional regulator [Pseudoxanthomonas gei]|uniref:FMN-binding negative transcriptional regulator n=1 Tax=Pseudoxanthomonas gei TaxID=1383030 RepID=A0ABX0A8R4_9GAMM|nr:FMN-binding negative transcriptional regulator [Pseudoxanthomonas gei]NDK37308.1 FMN-binding negative transcriptional regulator [Pseudoxanthomonas gei]
MYTPRAFVETDLEALDRLFERDSFVTLVTAPTGAPFASHLPVIYTRNGDNVLVEGHWARVNPQTRHPGPALMIVHGPHAYISPGWYADKEQASRVPTWNYAVAHLSGSLESSEDEAFLAGIVDRLSARHESALGSDWRYEHDRQSHRSQLRGITGFRFVPERIELAFKLSQNHPLANVQGAVTGLQGLDDPQAHEVAGLMIDHLHRRTHD